jgi:hypothetical protein
LNMVVYLTGTRAACINAATLALADAGIPMRDIVTSCSAGYLCSTPLLDLNYIEDSAGGPDVTVGFLTKMDKVTLLQVTKYHDLLFDCCKFLNSPSSFIYTHKQHNHNSSYNVLSSETLLVLFVY